MRFLHTSDWHAGKPLRRLSRLDEQQQVAAEILDIAVRETADCVLFSGDLFDSYAPPPEAERLAYEFLAELAGRKIAAVVIGGNHDHPKRLGALRALLDRMQLFIRPEPCRPADGGVIAFREARIAVLPFVTERKIVDVCTMMQPEEKWAEQYAGKLSRMIAMLCADLGTATINLLLGHLYVHGSEASGSERQAHLAAPYAIPPQQFPKELHYIALGHLHRPQAIEAPSKCYYAGSPLQLDFGECGQQKAVNLIDASPGRPARIATLPLSRGRRLREVAGTLDELRSAAPSFGSDHLKVKVRCQSAVPGLADQVRDALPNAVDIRLDFPVAEAAPQADLGRLGPAELFDAYFRSREGREPSPELAELFARLHDEVLHEAD